MTRLIIILGLVARLLAPKVFGAGLPDENLAKLPADLHIIKADESGSPYVDPVTNVKFRDIPNKLDKEITIHDGKEPWIIEPRQNVRLDYDPNYPYLLITDNERVLLNKDFYNRHVTTTAIERLKEEAAERPPASDPEGPTGTSNSQHEEWYENLAPNPVLGTGRTADKQLPTDKGESQKEQFIESSRDQAELPDSTTGSSGEKRPTDAPMEEIQDGSNSRPVEPRVPDLPIRRDFLTGRLAGQKKPKQKKLRIRLPTEVPLLREPDFSQHFLQLVNGQKCTEAVKLLDPSTQKDYFKLVTYIYDAQTGRWVHQPNVPA
ncbi:hypothetical protein MJO28_003982 [Puccinia striiformis f. sp. tritici]|uniref:Uncharacterized protein n=1 Tax=Puccinia striiformis f. sp. tritici TaxID=168172 RepID=A0ACC0EPT2_9BASI|nr:hypothetical protein MJO28_003982 [Puccinia striiformis f. sp. tritici]KAI9627153.1 hypothetical protein KEM48_009982 [Puccinia striiformis f. sp. tritici PST-130]